MTEKGGTFGIDGGGYKKIATNSLSANKVDSQPENPSKLNPAIEAKMEHWKEMVLEKWNIFHDNKSEEKNVTDCKIEKNSKIKILKSILEDISASPSNNEGQDERQKELSRFMDKIEKIEKSSTEKVTDFLIEIKEIEGVKDSIRDFFFKNL
ncbi:MAG: hypothetical protein WAV23_03630 [Minisyncoccia bacterium]